MNEHRKTTMSVREMGSMLGLKKVESYWLVHKNYFETITVQGKMRVVVESFEHWYAGQVKYHKINGDPPGLRLRLTSYSPADIGEMLGISTASAYELIKAYGIPTITVDYLKRVRKEDYDHWYANQDKYMSVRDRMLLEATYGETLSMPEIAKILDVPRSTVYSILRSQKNEGVFREVMVGHKRHITRDSFEKWYLTQEKYLRPEDEPEGYERKTKRYLDSLTGKKAVKAKKKRDMKRSANPDYVTIDEAAEVAGVHRATMLDWIKKGRIEVIRISPKVMRISRAHLDQCLSDWENTSKESE